MKILAIETSCDDTCIAILEIKKEKLEILSNVVSSQVKLHAKYGGVYPTLAKREHQRNLPLALKKAQSKAGNPKIDLIAITIGPGLEPCLWVGVNFAKELAEKWGLPIMPVNHIEAHILANFINKLQVSSFKFQELFPAICLVVSGGHTQLILMKDIGKYKILGETRDDAAGECFDKTSRILGLDYPGGPAIAAEAAKFQITSTKLQISTKFKITNFKQILNSKFKIKLPRPMMYQKNYDFSFSGLKTAVLYNAKDLSFKIKDKKYVRALKRSEGSRRNLFLRAMATEIQQSIIDVLIHKTLKATKDYQVKTIILGGGVIANNELQKQFKIKIKKEIPNFKLYIPKPNMCTDNAVMIGVAAYFNLKKKSSGNAKHSPATLCSANASLAYLENIKADANLRIS